MANKCTEKAEYTCRSYPNCYGCNAYRNPTNYDKIKHMSLDEIAKNIYLHAHNMCSFCTYSKGWHCTSELKTCVNGIKQWLESEVEEE